MSNKIKKVISFILPIAAFCLFLFVMLNFAHAQNSLGNDAFQYLEKDLPSFSAPEGTSGQDMVILVIKKGISLVKYFVGAIALMLGLIYGVSFVLARGNEDTIKKRRTDFLWMLMGFIVLMCAQAVADIFNPVRSTSENLIDFQAAHDLLRDITNYVKWLVGSVIVLFMTVSGIKLIIARGNEEVITKQKNNLIYSMIGMLIILLASNIVSAIYVVKNPETIIAADSTKAVSVIGSIIRLLLVFLGPVTILFTISAGFMYISAFENEDRAKTARKMMVGGVTGIIIVYMSYALVSTFMTSKLTPDPTLGGNTTSTTTNP